VQSGESECGAAQPASQRRRWRAGASTHSCNHSLQSSQMRCAACAYSYLGSARCQKGQCTFDTPALLPAALLHPDATLLHLTALTWTLMAWSAPSSSRRDATRRAALPSSAQAPRPSITPAPRRLLCRVQGGLRSGFGIKGGAITAAEAGSVARYRAQQAAGTTWQLACMHAGRQAGPSRQAGRQVATSAAAATDLWEAVLGD
jgi:hypothetical protein